MQSDEQTEQAYIPGVFRCAKCGFRLHQMTLNANSGAVTARDAPGEKCPNDGSPMWRVTYSEQLAEAHEEWGKQVERAAEAERKLDAIRDALEPVRHWYDGEPADGEDHKPRELVDILADVVSDLQSDRAGALAMHAALQPFAAMAKLIDSPFGVPTVGNDIPFSSGGAWRQKDGETRTLTYGDFRKARTARDGYGGEKIDV